MSAIGSSSATQTRPWRSSTRYAIARAAAGIDRSGCAGIFTQAPVRSYSQPWYGQTMQPPRTSPSDSAAPRWMQRSLRTVTPVSVRNATRSSSSSVKRRGCPPTSSAVAIGCQNCDRRMRLAPFAAFALPFFVVRLSRFAASAMAGG